MYHDLKKIAKVNSAAILYEHLLLQNYYMKTNIVHNYHKHFTSEHFSKEQYHLHIKNFLVLGDTEAHVIAEQPLHCRKASKWKTRSLPLGLDFIYNFCNI